MNRRVELWNDKEIATTLTTPGIIRMAVGRNIWSKIPRKTFVKKLINKCGCLIYLFGVLRHFQHCTGDIMRGSWKGRGNQYLQFVRVLYCKLPTNGKQLPAFPLEAVPGIEPQPQRWEASVTTCVAVLNTVRCSTGSQCNCLSTEVILVYSCCTVLDTL